MVERRRERMLYLDNDAAGAGIGVVRLDCFFEENVDMEGAAFFTQSIKLHNCA